MTDVDTRRPRAATPGRASRTLSVWLWGLLGVLCALAAWTVLAVLFEHEGPGIAKISSPAEVAVAIAGYAGTSLVPDAISSIWVFLGGWVLGSALAILTGLLLGRIGALRRIFLPIIEAIRPVSSIAWIPLSIVWFGFGYSGKVFIVGLAVYLVVIVYAIEGTARIPEILERASTMLGMSRVQKMRFVVLPSMFSEVLIGLRVALMSGWGTVIIAELLAADSGMGNSLIMAQRSYDIPGVMAMMLCFGAVGFLLNAAFGLVLRLARARRETA